MINLCSATTILHWFSKFLKLFETFREFHIFVFRYRATNENTELEENRIRVIFHWQKLWEGIRIGPGIILRLFYQWRKEIMIVCGFRQFLQFRGIDLAHFLPFPFRCSIIIHCCTSLEPHDAIKFFYKQLLLSYNPESCLYFQDF